MAGYLVEVLDGEPYANAMESLVFRPLGMSRTTLRPTMAYDGRSHRATMPVRTGSSK